MMRKLLYPCDHIKDINILLKQLFDNQLTLSTDQFILFDYKSFLASPKVDNESVHLAVGRWAAMQKKPHRIWHVWHIPKVTFIFYTYGIFASLTMDNRL